MLKKAVIMMNKLNLPNYLLTLQSPVLAENTETICGVCHNLAFKELIAAQYELSDMEVLEIARKKIFDFNYKFYDDLEKRKALETGILKHFWFDEIGQETYAYWKFELQHWFEVNMDRYYTLFKTIPFQDQDDPTANTNYTEVYTRDSSGKTQASGEDTSIALNSVTPEGRVDINTNDYVNNIAKTISKPNSANDSTGHEEYSFSRKGNIGIQTLAEVLQGSRRAVITIESELYTELQEYGLFFNIF
jgi:hypothetical protein